MERKSRKLKERVLSGCLGFTPLEETDYILLATYWQRWWQDLFSDMADMSGKDRSPGSNLDKVQPTFATQYKGPLVLSPHL